MEAGMGVAVLAALVLALKAGAYKPPRTPDGRPDLGGDWTTEALTGLERDDASFKSLVATEAEAKAYEAMMNDPGRAAAYFAELRRKGGRPTPPDVGAQETQQYSVFRMAHIRGEVRTSVITDPADGRLPYTQAAKAVNRAARKRFARVFDNPEDRDVVERCIFSGGGGPPFDPTFDTSNFAIVQTKGEVAIVVEAYHDVRHIRMGGPHAQAVTAGWSGDSVGEWQGDVLRVETTAFPDALGKGIGLDFLLSPRARVTEWFSRTGPDEITYRFQVDDPETYTRPWRGEMLLTRTALAPMEFACHEGNYSLGGVLRGARRVEAQGGEPEPLDGGDPQPRTTSATWEASPTPPSPGGPPPGAKPPA